MGGACPYFRVTPVATQVSPEMFNLLSLADPVWRIVPLLVVGIPSTSLQGYLAHQKTPTLLGPPRTLGRGAR